MKNAKNQNGVIHHINRSLRTKNGVYETMLEAGYALKLHMYCANNVGVVQFVEEPVSCLTCLAKMTSE